MGFRRAAGAVLAAAGVAAGLVAAAAPAQADGAGYYQTSWSSTVYQVASDGTPTPLTHDQWVAAGQPTPTAATDVYSRFSWDPSIYRRTFFGTFPEFELHSETAAEWAAAGRPAPVAGDPQDASTSRWETSDELFATTPDGLVHRLTGPQWAEIKDLPPQVRTDQGYAKLSWAAPIAFMTSLSAGAGAPVTAAQWAAQDFPTPRAVQRFPGDQFYRFAGSSTIFYAGPTMNRAITAAEWAAAGRPAPTVRGGSTAVATGPVVTPGAFCSKTATTGVTKTGRAEVCSATAADPYRRWRAA